MRLDKNTGILGASVYIDDQLVALFRRRMEVSSDIAAYKKEHGMQIYDAGREREKLADVAEMAGSEMANYTRVLYSMLFELSRSYPSKRNHDSSPLFAQITKAIEYG